MIMITKTVKEYSNRKRIDLNKKDGFNAGEDIILMSSAEYDDLQSQIKEYENLYNETKTNLNNLINQQETQQKNIDLMIEKVSSNIDKSYEKILQDKDNQIKRLTIQVTALNEICSQFKDKINQLSLWDMVVRKKHYDIVNDFTKSIWIINKDDDNIINADEVPAITDDSKQEQ